MFMQWARNIAKNCKSLCVIDAVKTEDPLPSSLASSIVCHAFTCFFFLPVVTIIFHYSTTLFKVWSAYIMPSLCVGSNHLIVCLIVTNLINLSFWLLCISCHCLYISCTFLTCAWCQEWPSISWIVLRYHIFHNVDCGCQFWATCMVDFWNNIFG